MKRTLETFGVCPICNGQDRQCGACEGRGVVMVSRTTEIDEPPMPTKPVPRIDDVMSALDFDLKAGLHHGDLPSLKSRVRSVLALFLAP